MSSTSRSSAPAARRATETERAPLLPAPTSTDPSEEMVPSPSTAAIWARSLSNVQGIAAQIGLLVGMVVLWSVLWEHPAGLFSYHPYLQSVAVIGFAEGILLLQPEPKNVAIKKKGLKVHQAVQSLSSVIIIAGAIVIIYNKAIHSAKHFQSWHGIFGLATLILIALQLIFGVLIVWGPATKLLGGDGRAKSLWRWHRMSGYLTLTMLFVTPLLALDSDWLRNNSSSMQRSWIGAGLGVAGVGILLRISLAKLGLRR